MKNEIKKMVFDYLDTADGHSIYWLHAIDNNTISPDDLSYDKYEFMEVCSHIVTDGVAYQNYAIDELHIEEWEKEREEIEKEHAL